MRRGRGLGGGNTRHDPVTGPENPIAPPLEYVGVDSRTIEATTTLGLPYQGPPSSVHGGVSALLLDHTLGAANGWAGKSGMTAELTLRYHRLTPLFEPLTITARQVSVDGTKTAQREPSGRTAKPASPPRACS